MLVGDGVDWTTWNNANAAESLTRKQDVDVSDRLSVGSGAALLAKLRAEKLDDESRRQAKTALFERFFRLFDATDPNSYSIRQLIEDRIGTERVASVPRDHWRELWLHEWLRRMVAVDELLREVSVAHELESLEPSTELAVLLMLRDGAPVSEIVKTLGTDWHLDELGCWRRLRLDLAAILVPSSLDDPSQVEVGLFGILEVLGELDLSGEMKAVLSSPELRTSVSVELRRCERQLSDHQLTAADNHQILVLRNGTPAIHGEYVAPTFVELVGAISYDCQWLCDNAPMSRSFTKDVFERLSTVNADVLSSEVAAEIRLLRGGPIDARTLALATVEVNVAMNAIAGRLPDVEHSERNHRPTRDALPATSVVSLDPPIFPLSNFQECVLEALSAEQPQTQSRLATKAVATSDDVGSLKTGLSTMVKKGLIASGGKGRASQGYTITEFGRNALERWQRSCTSEIV